MEPEAAVAAEPAGVETPAEATGAGEQAAEQIDWSAKVKDDATLAEFIRKEADRLRQRERDRERRQQRRQLAQEVETAPDESQKAAKATELAKLVATEEDPEERDNQTFVQKARVAEQGIARLRNTDEYAELWNREGKAEMDRRWHQDPETYVDWIWEQITDMRAEKRARPRADVLSQAKAEDIANQRLRNVPTPMTGGASSPSAGGMTLDRLLDLPDAERRQWKQEHKRDYDDLVAALSQA